MPRNSQGIYSLPTGNPVVSGTLIESEWANTTLDDIADALTSSLPRDGSAPMTGPLILSATMPTVDAEAASKAYVDQIVTGPAPGSRTGNKLVNGGFTVWQRGSGPFTNTGFTADRWYLTRLSGSISISRITKWAANIADQCFGQYAASINMAGQGYLRVYVEGADTFANSTVCFSYKTNDLVTNTGGPPTVVQGFGTGGSAPVYTEAASVTTTDIGNGMFLKEVVFDIPSVAGKSINDAYLDNRLEFVFSYDGTATGYLLFDVQLELGSAATRFNMRDIEEELLNCERFYQKMTQANLRVSNQGFISLGWRVMLPARMRVTPTITSYSLTQGALLTLNPAPDSLEFQAQCDGNGVVRIIDIILDADYD